MHSSRVFCLLAAALALALASTTAAQALTLPNTTAAARQQNNCWEGSQCSFVDHFDRRDDARWFVSDNTANWNPFGSWWSAARVQWWDGLLALSVKNTPKLGRPYATGEIRTRGWHGYGCYEVRMKPVAQPGLISTFFTYTGKHNNVPGYKAGHNEIDVEFVWSERLKKLTLQCNYFTNKKGQHEKRVPLNFAPEKAFHNYAFKWTRRSIQWYVDGKQVHQAWNKPGDPLPTINKNVPGGPHKIYMNFWVVNPRNAAWGGAFKYMGQRGAHYQAVRFTKGENCKIKNWF